MHNSVVCANAPWAALQRLTDLGLWDCYLTAVPEQLSALTALTRLILRGNERLTSGWQHLLPLTQLQGLDLSWCNLTAVPEQVSALTALTRLDLSHSYELTGGWHHPLPLTRLLDLNLSSCGVTAVPQQLSALTALTRLDLCDNNISSGWHHLLPLTGLAHLTLSRAPVPAELATLLRLRISYMPPFQPFADHPEPWGLLFLLILWAICLAHAYGWLD
ncbi:hypothetical protein D9Q98_002490 [Chlorella vulgaris]|uniref:Uncharacterized protein n=1 Tax=Chlorella vulgaris TaxID=3077 RepID=A0A9D4TTJ1_CHLVU|nr:hypothetical protein D9Q98_002490 [Chlorella vulgaris]